MAAAKISNLEKIVDILITPAVIVIAVLIIGELFFGFEKYEPWLTIADLAVVGVFILDLILKYRRVHDLKKFVKLYWLEILAVFPFYLLFRGFSILQNLLPFGDSSEVLQRTLHETSLLRESRELEVFTKEERLAARGLRFGQRVLRLVAARLHHAYRRLRHAHHKV
jgi:hypothetical protein